MPRSVSEVRLDDVAVYRYVLFVEGEPDAYTDDESGGLIGTGLNSWIGNSETAAGAAGGNEVLGTRRVRGGLIVPQEVSFAIEPKTGELQPAPASFQILDVDDTLSYLFASEGKDYVQLGERIAPGTTALGTSVTLYDGVATTNPRGQYIGIERIGPSGQRRFCPALPYTLVGFDHAVGASLPAVQISGDPIDFAGRMVTLYRIYKVRPELDDSDPTAWALWSDAEDAGDRVWWGVLRDAGNVGGNNIWSIDCHGPDALTRKTLGTRSNPGWMQISADLELTDDERYVSIGFMSQTFGGNQFHYQGSAFSHQITVADVRSQICADINGWIEDAMDGTSVNTYATEDLFEDWEVGAGEVMEPDAGVQDDGTFHIRRVPMNTYPGSGLQFGIMCIAMHERAWRRIGWEPERQHLDGVAWEDLTRCRFRKLEVGAYVFELGANVPAAGYWMAYFNTVTPGASIWDSEYYANSGGGPRLWEPMHTASVFVLDNHANQVVRLIGKGPADVYIEGQPTAGIESDDNEIDSNPVEMGRWFVLKGEYITKMSPAEDGQPAEVDETETAYFVAKGEWIEGTRYGELSEGDGVVPALYLSYFEAPRAWGFHNEFISNSHTGKLKAPWAGKVEGQGIIEITPLHAYHYERYTKPFEVAPSVWLNVMLSTGSAEGYDAAHDAGGTFAGGENQPVSPGLTFMDCELADMGCGVPYQIVQTPSEIYAAFDTVNGGAEGALNRVRYGYIGPYQSREVLESLMRPRLLCWSLHGKSFGVFKLGPVSAEDADIEILEDDLYGDPLDPTTVIPVQALRATGQLDRVDLAYRMNPAEGKTELAAKFPALDPGARARTGELVESVTEHGLCPPWFGSGQADVTGVEPWGELFRTLWAKDAAAFFAKRHYTLELTVSRPKGQDAMPGTSVAITNPWPVNPRGGRGITSATGRVLAATHNLRDCSARLQCIVFAGQPVVHYSPAVLIGQVVGTSVTWYDYTDVDADGRGFVEPDWSDTGGEMQVDLYQRTGLTWAVAFSAGVVSVDLATRTAVLDAAPGSAILRDKDTWMVARSWSDQNANEWPRALYGVQADTDQTVGDGSTKAPEFVV
jgi:hypothetical protein